MDDRGSVDSCRSAVGPVPLDLLSCNSLFLLLKSHDQSRWRSQEVPVTLLQSLLMLDCSFQIGSVWPSLAASQSLLCFFPKHSGCSHSSKSLQRTAASLEASALECWHISLSQQDEQHLLAGYYCKSCGPCHQILPGQASEMNSEMLWPHQHCQQGMLLQREHQQLQRQHAIMSAWAVCYQASLPATTVRLIIIQCCRQGATGP